MALETFKMYIKAIACIISASILCIILAVWGFQNKFLYIPDLPGAPRKKMLKNHVPGIREEEIWLTAEDGVRLQSWFIDSKSDITMYFCHENAGNLSHRWDFYNGLVKTVQVNVFVVSYRGYGLSEGSPTESGIQMDSKAGLDFLRRHDRTKDIVVFGSSLGCAVAIHLLADNIDCHLIRGLILQNPFTSIDDMIDKLTGISSIKKFSSNKWDNKDKIQDIEVPILFIASQRDEVVPCGHSETLMESAVRSKRKKIIRLKNARHNDCLDQPGYFEYVRDFVDSVV